MKFSGLIAFAASGLFGALFLINLIAARRGAGWLGTASEALVLLVAVALFGIGTLILEHRSKR
ncbi:hypothetical protein [Paracoccus sp. 22332]|uniref:hypothetical protein n=1 Tax=Paracoccus sp. 22332 TaxID=3453913 RepID=UPI003F843AED